MHLEPPPVRMRSDLHRMRMLRTRVVSTSEPLTRFRTPSLHRARCCPQVRWRISRCTTTLCRCRIRFVPHWFGVSGTHAVSS
ncbi:hypothetical protein EJ02DRAFT_254810 [Clathrospora elynae]|uniref:Uncharacterized protein n=1 Tax=Clathrospora elynae TaxID=706981 RepID=A0A6A5SQX7_9PLEO|nr:hypothetical protein EJ02DRAFT_254810 [Clathrospora elynae]